jgi:mannose-6-phosphate isomerase-like protein (cupin superfamily)
MKMNVDEYIKSGILELYVLGLASETEIKEVERMAGEHPVIRKEIFELNNAIESLAKKHSRKPSLTVKPMVLAGIDYMERLKKGEPLSYPPELNENSKIQDYAPWLERQDMVAPARFDEIYVKLIGYTPQMTTGIVWIKEMAPEEVHNDEFERFLIVEGECEIYVDGKPNVLVPGNYFSIPLHSVHHVKVTSDIPCKVILQRVAA